MSTLSLQESARKKADIRGRWLRSAPALVLVTLGAAAPLLVVFIYSFLSPGDYGDVKFELSGQGWFGVLFEVDFLDGTVSFAQTNLDVLVRSIKLALLTTLICAIVGFPTAFFIATRKRQVRSVWLFLITIPFWTNMLIRTFAIQDLLRTEGIVNFQLLRFGIIDQPIQFLYTDTAVLLGMLYVFLPLMVLPLYSSLEKFDFRLVEAAYDLYASRWAMLTKVIMPLAAPGLIAGSVLVFIPAVSNYIVPQLLGGGKNMMIGNLIDLQFGQGRNWPLGSALAVSLVAIVSVVLVVVMRRAKGAEVSHG
ncbi:ABC transporter permease [Rhizobium oryziradicis]|uniref:ABC transporter permease n=1 Tax=Rhizobium oryziradicis TaxID=1867956 RepID=A0A1Q8ZWA8_9HYPH|nr:ABC transporter permease [Rhizobium oryziradicis]OLP46364.1 ABC transporter permease [Rhizobium oryziradicis]